MTKINLKPFHRFALMFPPMTAQEFNNLVADIKKHGQRDDIDLWNGKIIEGVHRAKACQQLGIEPRYRERRFENEAGALAYAISKNLHRRHLDTKQKRDLVGKLLEADPTKSDTTIGKQAKVSKNTVAKVRKEKEGRGQIDHVEKRTDSKGRSQPATKAKAKLPVPPSKGHERSKPPVEEPGVDGKPQLVFGGMERISAAEQADDGGLANELDALRSFAIFTIKNVDDDHLKLTGDPERFRRWKDLRDRVAPFVKIGV
jgi:hypothetical protein